MMKLPMPAHVGNNQVVILESQDAPKCLVYPFWLSKVIRNANLAQRLRVGGMRTPVLITLNLSVMTVARKDFTKLT